MEYQITKHKGSQTDDFQGEVLEERAVEYRLPNGVQLLKFHVPKETHSALRADVPKVGRLGLLGERKGWL